MKIDFEDRTWEVSTDDIGLRQAMVITSRLGVSLTGWEKILTDPDSPQWLSGVECLYWLMLAQDGQQVPIGEVDFAVLKLADAFASAALAEAEAAKAAEPDPTEARRRERRGGATQSGNWLTRYWDEPDLRMLRARYLFDLAATCHCPPPVVDQMRFLDFAVLAEGLEQMRAEQRKAAQGASR